MLPQDDKNEGTFEGTNERKGNREVSKKVDCVGEKGMRERGEELI